MSEPMISASVEVAAPAEVVYALVTDLDAMGEVNEENTGGTWVRGSAAVPGSVFKGHNRHGRRRWSTTCTVATAEPGRRFAFEVTTVAGIGVARWEFSIEPLDAGRCRVTESMWDRRPGWFKKPAGLVTGTFDREPANRANVEATLARLRARVEA